MKLEQSFEVDAPLDRVWEALVNVERVAPCLPGAAVTGRNEDGSYSGTFTIKIGPTTASYTGKLEMQNVDVNGHTATMHAQGSDKRGQGGATATIVSTLSAHDRSTRVDVMTDYHITGRLARFGRGGMIEDISERLLREFAGRLQSSLSGGAESETANAGAGAVQEAVATGQPSAAAVAASQPSRAATTADDDEQPTQEQPRLIAKPAETPPAPTEAAAPAAAEAPAIAGEGEAPAPAQAPPSSVAPPPPPARAEPVAPPPPPGEASAEPIAPEPEALRPEPEPMRPQPQAAPPPPPPPPSSEPTEPVNGLALVGSVLLERVRSSPKPLLAIAGGALVLGLLWRRR
jgi:uncharacterized protein